MNKQSILITGAAGGIGRETALLFARKGWFVGIFDVNKTGLETVESEIGKTNCFSGIMDITDLRGVQNGIDAFVAQTGGKLDVLLNNAAIMRFGHFENVDLEGHHNIIDVNVKGFLNCIYHSLKYLKQTPGSRIINMSSMATIYGIPDFAVYAATKCAISSMTEALNLELEKYDIFVCDIKPPVVKTPILEGSEDVYSFKVLKFFMDPSKVAKAIWKAAHRRKLHRYLQTANPMAFLFWLMPFARRFVTKALTIPRQ